MAAAMAVRIFFMGYPFLWAGLPQFVRPGSLCPGNSKVNPLKL